MYVASLVLGIIAIISWFSPIGWVVSIVGLILSGISVGNKEKYGENGRGMAVAGLVLNIVSVALIATVAIAFSLMSL